MKELRFYAVLFKISETRVLL